MEFHKYDIQLLFSIYPKCCDYNCQKANKLKANCYFCIFTYLNTFHKLQENIYVNDSGMEVEIRNVHH